MHFLVVTLLYAAFALMCGPAAAAHNAKDAKPLVATHDWRKRDFDSFIRRFPKDVFLHRHRKKVLVQTTNFVSSDDVFKKMQGPIDEFLGNVWFGGNLSRVFQLGLDGLRSVSQAVQNEGPFTHFSAELKGGLHLERKGAVVKVRNHDATEVALELVDDPMEKSRILSSLKLVPLPSNRRPWFTGAIGRGIHFYMEEGMYDSHPSLLRAYGGKPSEMRELKITDVSFPDAFNPVVETEMGTMHTLENGSAVLVLPENETMSAEVIRLDKAGSDIPRRLGIKPDHERLFVPYF